LHTGSVQFGDTSDRAVDHIKALIRSRRILIQPHLEIQGIGILLKPHGMPLNGKDTVRRGARQ
jgi:hypothetical protein